MSYRYAHQPELNLVLVVYEGKVTAEEEKQALGEVVQHPKTQRDSRFLVDRSRAEMAVGPEHVRPHIDQVKQLQALLGKPRVAIVVASDYDFGLMRMFEMTSDDELTHDFMIFRSFDEAHAWLEIEPAAVQWP